MKFTDRIKRGWNVFRNEEETRATDPEIFNGSLGFSTARPDRIRTRYINPQSLLNSITNRIGVDFSDVVFKHVRLDESGRYLADEKSSLNECFLVSPNLDQSPSDLRRDIGTTMLREGVIAIVPVDTDIDPEYSDGFKIESLRVGTIVQWYTRKVRIQLYRDDTGKFEEITLPKRSVAIVENPFYTIMNEPNSTAQRLARKMSLMDAVDEQIGAGKLDLIVQLPYVIKTDSKKNQAEKRRSELEEQLRSSQYGVAYTDGTERVIQLNRPVENNLLKNVESLTKLLYDQLGITAEILNGTANEATMLNYQNRIIKPMLVATVEEMQRKFLSKTARTQNQSIEFYQDRFALVPAATLADLSDKLTRNAILSSNEFRQILGYAPVTNDPLADKLVNKNMPLPAQELSPSDAPTEE